MRNRHPGMCYRCGLLVERGMGHFEKKKSGEPGPMWRTQHAICAVKWRGTDKKAGDGR